MSPPCGSPPKPLAQVQLNKQSSPSLLQYPLKISASSYYYHYYYYYYYYYCIGDASHDYDSA